MQFIYLFILIHKFVATNFLKCMIFWSSFLKYANFHQSIRLFSGRLLKYVSALLLINKVCTIFGANCQNAQSLHNWLEYLYLFFLAHNSNAWFSHLYFSNAPFLTDKMHNFYTASFQNTKFSWWFLKCVIFLQFNSYIHSFWWIYC